MAAHESRWRARRVEATAVHAAAFAIPFVAGLGVSALFVLAVHRPARVSVWEWRAVAVAIATATALAVDPVVRPLLPLAALLRMSLLFPGRAPSRLALGLGARGGDELDRLLAADLSGYTEERAAEHVLRLVAALNGHDKLTRGHSERVWGYARLIGDQLGLSEHDADRLHWAALLHDVGKLGVSRAILTKRGRPTPAEWAEIKTHPDFGARLVAPLAGWLGPWADAVAQHHERYDGAGYPGRLSGGDISLGGRIVAVIDSYDVMTSARSYKRPVSSRHARAELGRCAGSQFDPDVVDAFLNVSAGRARFAAGPLAGIAQLPLISTVAQTGAAVGAATTAGVIPAATALAMTGLVPAPAMAALTSGNPAAAAPVASHVASVAPVATPPASRAIYFTSSQPALGRPVGASPQGPTAATATVGAATATSVPALAGAPWSSGGGHGPDAISTTASSAATTATSFAGQARKSVVSGQASVKVLLGQAKKG